MTGRERALKALGGVRTDRPARYCDLWCPGIIRALGGPGEGLEPRARAVRELGVDMTRGLSRLGFQAASPPRPVRDTLARTKEAHLRARDAAGDDFLALLEFPHSILGGAMAHHGAMDLFSALASSPAAAAAVLESAAQDCIAMAGEIVSWDDVPAVLFMDDLAGSAGPLISPDTLRALYFPRLREVFAILSGGGTRVIFHSDGDLTMVSRDILESGAAGHHPVEPVGRWGLERAANGRGDVLLVGNAALGKICASVEAAEAERKRCTAFGLGHAAYFMAPATEIGPEVPLENLRAFFA